MELKQIKELMGAMTRSGIKKLLLKEGDFELQLEQDNSNEQVNYIPPALLEQEHSRHYVAPLPSAEMHLTPQHHNPVPHQPATPAAEDKSKYITSPMVGTYYSQPSPDDPTFVKVGDHVQEGAVVCIIEAMKVMNEVKSNVGGQIVEILVENGQPVEFGTKIFRVV